MPTLDDLEQEVAPVKPVAPVAEPAPKKGGGTSLRDLEREVGAMGRTDHHRPDTGDTMGPGPEPTLLDSLRHVPGALARGTEVGADSLARGIGGLLAAVGLPVGGDIADTEQHLAQARLNAEQPAGERLAGGAASLAEGAVESAPLFLPGGQALFAGTTFGNRYQDRLDKGGTKGEALATGGADALLALLLPKILGSAAGELVPAAMPGAKALGKIVEGGGTNAGFTLGQAAVSQTYDPERALEELKSLPKSAAIGGGLGAVGALLSKVIGTQGSREGSREGTDHPSLSTEERADFERVLAGIGDRQPADQAITPATEAAGGSDLPSEVRAALVAAGRETAPGLSPEERAHLMAQPGADEPPAGGDETRAVPAISPTEPVTLNAHELAADPDYAQVIRARIDQRLAAKRANDEQAARLAAAQGEERPATAEVQALSDQARPQNEEAAALQDMREKIRAEPTMEGKLDKALEMIQRQLARGKEPAAPTAAERVERSAKPAKAKPYQPDVTPAERIRAEEDQHVQEAHAEEVPSEAGVRSVPIEQGRHGPGEEGRADARDPQGEDGLESLRAAASPSGGIARAELQQGGFKERHRQTKEQAEAATREMKPLREQTGEEPTREMKPVEDPPKRQPGEDTGEHTFSLPKRPEEAYDLPRLQQEASRQITEGKLSPEMHDALRAVSGGLGEVAEGVRAAGEFNRQHVEGETGGFTMKKRVDASDFAKRYPGRIEDLRHAIHQVLDGKPAPDNKAGHYLADHIAEALTDRGIRPDYQHSLGKALEPYDTRKDPFATTGEHKVLGYGGSAAVKKLVWGDGSVLKDDVVPTAKAAAKGVAEAADDIRKTFAPQTGGKQAETMAGIAREHGAELAQRADRAAEALHEASKAMAKMPAEERWAFVDRMENGEKQPTPELQIFADTMREILDTKRGEIQALGKGKLEHFIEDYFPHLWKDPEKAASVFSQAAGRRPLEGGKSFLKKRSIPTVKEGMEAGLEPASDNPVDLVLLKAREMDKYLLGQRMLAEMKGKELAKFVRATDKAPEGYAKIDDRIAQVYGPPTVKFNEFVDKQVVEGLQKVIDRLGIKHERRTNAGRGRLGYSVQGGKEIVSQNATDLSVIAHELGHQLDHELGLGDYLLKQPGVRAETGALADLHGAKKAYFRSREERIASVVEAYSHAKERMQEVAPKTFKAFEDFIAKDERLAPLKSIRPSLQLSKIEFEKAHGGLLKMGEYYAPEAAARVINNYLSPGLRGKSAAFRGYLGVANFLNQAQLGLSAFHLGFTSLDAATSRFALGVEDLAHGRPIRALGEMASTPLAPLTNILKGSKVLKEWYSPGSQGEEMAAIVDGMRAAGGRAKMEDFLRSTAADRMMDAFRKGNILGGILRLPTGILDAAAKPIMSYIVPRQKMGIFADLARRELERLPAGADRDTVRAAMAKAWDSVDNRMGQLVYDNLFWNRTAKDLAMVSVRSLGWNLGTIRELGGGLTDVAKAGAKLATGQKPEFTHRMAYIVALPVVAGTLGAMVNYLMTGEKPKEMKDYFYPRTGQKDADGHDLRLSLPSYMKDVFQYAHAPVKTLIGKLHPSLGMIGDMLANKDFYGTEIRHADDPIMKQALQVAEYVGKSLLPLGVRNAQQGAKDNVSTGQKVAGFFGVTKAPYWLEQSDAEQLAGELTRARLPQGSRTQAQADRSAAARDLVNGLRSQDEKERSAAIDQLHAKVKDGTISKPELRSIEERSKKPRLDLDVKHLPLDESMKVWRVATPEERKRLTPVVRQKIANAQATPPGERRAYLDEMRAGHPQESTAP